MFRESGMMLKIRPFPLDPTEIQNMMDSVGIEQKQSFIYLIQRIYDWGAYVTTDLIDISTAMIVEKEMNIQTFFTQRREIIKLTCELEVQQKQMDRMKQRKK